jgi:hypothetical protein
MWRLAIVVEAPRNLVDIAGVSRHTDGRLLNERRTVRQRTPFLRHPTFFLARHRARKSIGWGGCLATSMERRFRATSSGRTAFEDRHSSHSKWRTTRKVRAA